MSDQEEIPHVTFSVDNVSPKRGLSREAQPLGNILGKMKISGVEAFESNVPSVNYESMNGFAGALNLAYSNHHPLILSPDDVWLAISQGLAIHVNENSEALRHHFVSHEGKADIIVEMPGFLKGSPENPWKDSLGTFSAEIAKHIGKKRDLLVAAFTTTGRVEQAASEVVLMGAMKNYFEYYGSTCCGIPEVTLLGTVEDWRTIRRRAEMLTEFDLAWWTAQLLPVLDQFVNAAEGAPDPAFWRNLYKKSGGSGGPYISGAVNKFFPYLKDYGGRFSLNPWMGREPGMMQGTNTDEFPAGLTSVPWTWRYYAQEFKMEFLGGFIGTSQDPDTFAVRPAQAWVVRDTKSSR